MDLSIIIVNWNSKNYVESCIASIMDTAPDISFEIVVIDNASFDGCGAMLKNKYPQVLFHQCEKNLGFAGANNTAFRLSTGNCLLFLNPDTKVLGFALQVLYNSLHSIPGIGIAGCKLLNADHTVQTSCISSFPGILNQILDSEFLRKRWPKSLLWGMAPLFSVDKNPQQAMVISGACMMMKRSVFEEAHYFSEEYFMYTEDVDLCYKVFRKGYRNYYLPTVSILHYGGVSSDQVSAVFPSVMMQQSRWRFFRKNRGLIYACGYRICILFSALVHIAILASMEMLEKGRFENRPLSVSRKKWSAILQWCVGKTNDSYPPSGYWQ